MSIPAVLTNSRLDAGASAVRTSRLAVRARAKDNPAKPAALAADRRGLRQLPGLSVLRQLPPPMKRDSEERARNPVGLDKLRQVFSDNPKPSHASRMDADKNSPVMALRHFQDIDNIF